MFEGISKNWSYLTTIGVIVGIAFGAGIWVKTSLDTLDTLPGRVDLIDGRLTLLEDIPTIIAQATCTLGAQTEMAKNEVLKYTINLETEKIREQVISLENLDEWTDKEERMYERLGKREQNLVKQRDEFQSKYEQQFEIYGRCK